MKTANPNLPILIRECSGIQPKLFARFDYGKENSVYLTNKTSKEVLEAVDQISKTGK